MQISTPLTELRERTTEGEFSERFKDLNVKIFSNLYLLLRRYARNVYASFVF